MKFVRMHNKSQKDFDEFVRKRLDEAEPDASMADKYFGQMQLPTQVEAPVASTNAFGLGWIVGSLMMVAIISIVIFWLNNDNTSNNPAGPIKTTIREDVTNNNNANNKKTSKLPSVHINENARGNRIIKEGDVAVDKPLKQTATSSTKINDGVKESKSGASSVTSNNSMNKPVTTAAKLNPTTDSLSAVQLNSPGAIRKPPTQLPQTKKEKPATDSLYMIW